jgi:diamine N-acetyltransferase
VIRPATPADAPALAELARRTWHEAFGWSVSTDDAARELDETRSESYFLRALADDTILVDERDGALVGYVQVGDVDIPEIEARPGDRALRRLYVEPALQRRGIGRALLEAALGHPRIAAAPRVYLQVWERNTAAIGLYERFGWRRVGTTRFRIGNELVEDLVMLLERG